jgi:hypothetical protein
MDMSNNMLALLNQQGGGVMPAALAAKFAGQKGDELSGGIGPSFATASIRGKTWRIKWQGTEHAIYLPANPEQGIVANTVAKPFIDVVIVRASPAISKNYYPNGYQQGSDDAPICFSTDGAKPDEASQVKQSVTCPTCPHNIWGSKVLPDGRKVKACQDLKRLAIVPAADIDNATFGGPMLLRVPPGSLKNMDAFNQALQAQNIPYFAVKTRVSFDPAAEYPLLQFEATGWLTEDEANRVLAMQNGNLVKRILSEEVAVVKAEPAVAVPSPVAVAPVMAPVAPPPPAPVPVQVAPPPPPVAVAPPPPEDPYQYADGPDGKLRWKQGMAAWEPVPVVAPVVAPPPSPPVVTPPPVAPTAPAVSAPVEATQDVTALMAALQKAGVDTSALTGAPAAGAAAPKPRKARTPNPSPTPTVLEGTATVVPPPVVAPPVVAPVTTPPVAEAPLVAQPGAGQEATAGIASKLSSML